ncbi:hypothetical protein GOC90_25425 [Sinorhizobium medicae]|uniref:hypothetical protein n=1 Tax=Sinorhizobium medicae TaxID=110321 RepID=UPI000FD6F98A|nr:hypothetical protein [Sinorhizobium medicae]MDX0610767.1 hypothetical protein [Sinorhizobium medicae]MDX0647808.1 hypothetical protein [Sinorhizobium medicae]MDX0760383.1 hypothetical protein [Sinorhizobium medicae]MDX0797101.1 hypothetical protein [Sinorhizobium medicae]MDX1109243.1 hypothetical protein [Sinorhizobium medicae]
MKHVRVNVRSVANTKAVRKEKRNGRDVVIVPSATLPDDIIMNGIRYPADEIGKSFAGLNRTPAPLGHPMINGKFVSARDPEGINVGYIGAWNENVRRENGRVFLDKVIDIEVANRSPGGKEVLAAIEKGEPVHTSTGLLANLEAVANASDHKHIARNIEFDHDAILLGEVGAATPDQGVGMLVNAQGEQTEIEVINSAIQEAERDIDWAMDSLARALEKRQRAGLLDKLKAAILEALGISEREPTTNTKDTEMPVTDEQFTALSAKVDALSEGFNKIGETVTNAVMAAVKPITDSHAEMVANQKAKDDAEHADLVTKIVKANVLDEETAKATPLNTLRALAKTAEPGKAAPLNPAFKANSGDKPAFKLPKGD